MYTTTVRSLDNARIGKRTTVSFGDEKSGLFASAWNESYEWWRFRQQRLDLERPLRIPLLDANPQGTCDDDKTPPPPEAAKMQHQFSRFLRKESFG
jgi:hypothetical protein